ncbi:hypothetical protein [Companilactobacillus halodurans]|uniref:Uncharacterized protein n=1 Tax=Companilactobacillus halodurans TaxID=2584183 RepID=A0A5P0ZMI4_9LACO|nr:hypothetical protein [Companilactobacillus halodurans]MQS75427.1 hypothetical protein [Companilactobacillus halodurans]MQS97268.1 hypothetical protein [Companilactobacillus halodurans]
MSNPNPYRYTLRLAIDKNIYDADKKQKLIDFVKKAHISDVAFFLNQEELSDTHITLDKAKELIKNVDEISQPIKELGITVSLNPWTTLNHSDRGIPLKKELDIKPMVNYQGVKSLSMACPGYAGFGEYISKIYAIWASIKPHELWLEDDFRHYKNAPFALGCFCEDHMKRYNDALGTNLSRQEFVDLMFKGGENKYRNAYLKVAREEILQVAHLIEQRVHEVSPETTLGLMSSWPEVHALEGRDWQKLLDELSGPDTPAVSRPHLPAYNEVSPQQYARDFEKYTVATRTEIGPRHKIYPEMESFLYSPYAKSNKFTQFQLDTTSLVHANGVLLNMFSMMGDGINQTYHYDSLLNSDKEFLDFLNEFGIDLENRCGIVIPMNQDVVKAKVDTTDTLEGLMASQTQWLELLSTMGFAMKPINFIDQEIKNKTVAVTGNFLNTLANEQIEQLFKRNFILLDGDAVEVLNECHLLKLINARSIEILKNRSGQQSFEQFDNETISGINNPRLTMLTHTGDYVKIDYAMPVTVHSSAYNRFEKKLGSVTVSDDKFYCLPMMDSAKYGWQAQYTDIREGDLKQFFEEQLSVPHLVDMYNCKLVIDSAQTTMIISNWSIDDVSGINFFLKDRNVKKVSLTYRDIDNQMKNKVLDVQLDSKGIYHIDFNLRELMVVHIKFLD